MKEWERRARELLELRAIEGQGNQGAVRALGLSPRPSSFGGPFYSVRNNFYHATAAYVPSNDKIIATIRRTNPRGPKDWGKFDTWELAAAFLKRRMDEIKAKPKEAVQEGSGKASYLAAAQAFKSAGNYGRNSKLKERALDFFGEAIRDMNKAKAAGINIPSGWFVTAQRGVEALRKGNTEGAYNLLKALSEQMERNIQFLTKGESTGSRANPPTLEVSVTMGKKWYLAAMQNFSKAGQLAPAGATYTGQVGTMLSGGEGYLDKLKAAGVKIPSDWFTLLERAKGAMASEKFKDAGKAFSELSKKMRAGFGKVIKESVSEALDFQTVMQLAKRASHTATDFRGDSEDWQYKRGTAKLGDLIKETSGFNNKYIRKANEHFKSALQAANSGNYKTAEDRSRKGSLALKSAAVASQRGTALEADYRADLNKQWQEKLRELLAGMKAAKTRDELERLYIASMKIQGGDAQTRALMDELEKLHSKKRMELSESVQEQELDRRERGLLGEVKRAGSSGYEIGGFAHGMASKLYRMGLVTMERGPRGTHILKITPKGASATESLQEAYWSGDDNRGYVMMFKGVELYVHPLTKGPGSHLGPWGAFVVWPNNSKEDIGRFSNRDQARQGAISWANKNASKGPSQGSLPGFESAQESRTLEVFSPKTQSGDGKTRSNGHLGFVGTWEYFVRAGEVLRAKVSSTYIDQGGYRTGGRSQGRATQWGPDMYQAHGFTQAQIGKILPGSTFQGNLGLESVKEIIDLHWMVMTGGAARSYDPIARADVKLGELELTVRYFRDKFSGKWGAMADIEPNNLGINRGSYTLGTSYTSEAQAKQAIKQFLLKLQNKARG